jgi:hypothetical protein
MCCRNTTPPQPCFANSGPAWRFVFLKAISSQVQFEYVSGCYPQAMDGARHRVHVVWTDRNRGTILRGTRVVVH